MEHFMAIWAIADLHLSFGVEDKKMDVFGENWRDHPDKIAENWKRLVKEEDLVLLAGDISWGISLEQALPDLEWIHALPGTKVMIRGNHDYWWSSLSKVEKILPPSIHVIQNNVFNWNGISVGGARMWDTAEYGFGEYIYTVPNDRVKPLTAKERDPARGEELFVRELARLEMSLKLLDPKASMRIVMTHYPPIGMAMEPSRISVLLEKYKVDVCVFGHLHNFLREGPVPFGEKNGVRYVYTAADYLDFVPVNILP